MKAKRGFQVVKVVKHVPPHMTCIVLASMFALVLLPDLPALSSFFCQAPSLDVQASAANLRAPERTKSLQDHLACCKHLVVCCYAACKASRRVQLKNVLSRGYSDISLFSSQAHNELSSGAQKRGNGNEMIEVLPPC